MRFSSFDCDKDNNEENDLKKFFLIRKRVNNEVYIEVKKRLIDHLKVSSYV